MLRCILVLLLVLPAWALQGAQCGRPSIEPVLDESDRIYGGQVAVPGSWPWQAQLYAPTYFCGGVLISDQHVLTAAHCVWNLPLRALTVRLGSHERSRKAATTIAVGADEICVHPSSYLRKTPGTVQDIAIIKLKRRVNTTRTIQPVCLPSHGEELATGSKLYVTGWGDVRDGKAARELKQAMVAAISHRDCRRLRPYIIRQIFCGGHRYGSTCFGDSGSPVVHWANGKWSLHGLVSGGPVDCGSKITPHLFTKVSSFIDTFIAPYINPRTSRQTIRSICRIME